jgi:hypothetical protein
MKKIKCILSLSQGYPPGIVSGLQSKEIFQMTQILDRKITGESSNQNINHLWSRAGNDNVIDIDQHKNLHSSTRIKEQGCIRLRGGETKSIKKLTQTSIPCTRRLFQTIDGALKLANMRRIPGVLETRRLLHIDILSQKPM